MKKEHISKIEMSMISERIIEVEITEKDLEKMKAEGVSEKDLPETGVKRYRPARHIIKDKDKITLVIDSDILEHFQKRSEEKNAAPCQTQINNELRQIMERDKKKLAA